MALRQIKIFKYLSLFPASMKFIKAVLYEGQKNSLTGHKDGWRPMVRQFILLLFAENRELGTTMYQVSALLL